MERKTNNIPLITPTSEFDAVILCDGDYPSHPIAQGILQQAKYLVCCDGAGMKLTQTFQSFARQQISIFNFGCHTLEGKGFKWNPYPYQEFWQGALNEALGDEVTIGADGSYLLFHTFEVKRKK